MMMVQAMAKRMSLIRVRLKMTLMIRTRPTMTREMAKLTNSSPMKPTGSLPAMVKVMLTDRPRLQG